MTDRMSGWRDRREHLRLVDPGAVTYRSVGAGTGGDVNGLGLLIFGVVSLALAVVLRRWDRRISRRNLAVFKAEYFEDVNRTRADD